MSNISLFDIDKEIIFLHILGLKVKGSNLDGAWDIVDQLGRRVGVIKRVSRNGLSFKMVFKTKRIEYEKVRKVSFDKESNDYSFWFEIKEDRGDVSTGCVRVGKNREVILHSSNVGLVQFSLNGNRVSSTYKRLTEHFDLGEKVCLDVRPNRNVCGDYLKHFGYNLQYSKIGEENVYHKKLDIDYIAPYYDEVERLKIVLTSYKNYFMNESLAQIVEGNMGEAIEKQEMGASSIREIREILNHVFGSDIIGNMMEGIELHEDIKELLYSRRQRGRVRKKVGTSLEE